MAVTDIAKLATCTTCSYSDDFSNYWTANLYFKARNGTYKRVPQVPNRYDDCVGAAWNNPNITLTCFKGSFSTTDTLRKPKEGLLFITCLAVREMSWHLSLYASAPQYRLHVPNYCR
jgi:hypothetical protein